MRERIEMGFARFGRTVVRLRWLAIALSVGLALGLASSLPPAIETSVESFLPEDDPARMLFDSFQEQFGRSEIVIVAVEPPDVFDLGFLEKLRALHRELEAGVPHLDEISSLINARSTRGEEDALVVEDLLEDFPSNPEELARLRARVLGNPFYRNTLVSEEGTFTTLLLTMDLHASDPVSSDEDLLADFDSDAPAGVDRERAYLSGFEVGEAVDAIRSIIERYDTPDFEVAMAGSPVIQQQLVKNLRRDLARFVVLMIGAVCLLLFVLFRRISGVVLPLLVVLLSLVSTVGAMAAAGAPISPPTQVLPTFLLAVGIGTAVHVLKIFYLRFDGGDSVEDAVAYTMSHSGLAIVMTGATTAGGLLSFLAAGLKPMVDLGRFAPLGVCLAVVYLPRPAPGAARRGADSAPGGRPGPGPLARAGAVDRRSRRLRRVPSVASGDRRGGDRARIAPRHRAASIHQRHHDLDAEIRSGRPRDGADRRGAPRLDHARSRRRQRTRERSPGSGVPRGPRGGARARLAASERRDAVRRPHDLDRGRREGDPPGTEREPRRLLPDPRRRGPRRPGVAPLREHGQRRPRGRRRHGLPPRAIHGQGAVRGPAPVQRLHRARGGGIPRGVRRLRRDRHHRLHGHDEPHRRARGPRTRPQLCARALDHHPVDDPAPRESPNGIREHGPQPDADPVHAGHHGLGRDHDRHVHDD